MTSPAENLQKYLAASTAAFGSVTKAWTDAVMGVYDVVLGWAVDEQVYVGPSETKVFVHVANATTLSAELHDVRDATVKVPAWRIHIAPSQLGAMKPGQAAAAVTVGVTPAPGCAPAYLGQLVDATTGAVVEPDVYISMMSG